MANINGSAKQITWAASIIETALKALPFAAMQATESLIRMTNHPAEMVEQLVAAYVAKLETKLQLLDSARYIIDSRSALTAGSAYMSAEIVKMLTTGKAGQILTALYCTADEVLEVRAAVKAAYEAKQAAKSPVELIEDAIADTRKRLNVEYNNLNCSGPVVAGLVNKIQKLEAELAAAKEEADAEIAAAEAEVEAAETAEAAEVAASEAAIETATETVSDAAPAQTLELYRLTVRCSDCCRRTKSLATEIAHYPWCTTLAQDPELLRTLQDKIAMSLDKRRQTKAAKLNAKIDELREAYSAVYASVGGNSALGIHKINGSTGLHTVRAYEGTCTCPGHKAHGHCKHLRLVRDARDAMQSIKRQLRDTSDRLLAMADRATQANCEW